MKKNLKKEVGKKWRDRAPKIRKIKSLKKLRSPKVLLFSLK